MSSFEMYLDDSKVGLRFGPRPHLGVKIPGTELKTTAGIRYNVFKKTYERNPIVVPRTMTLTRIRKGLWRVEVDDSARERAISVLQRHCSPYHVNYLGKPEPKRRRAKR